MRLFLLALILSSLCGYAEAAPAHKHNSRFMTATRATAKAPLRAFKWMFADRK